MCKIIIITFMSKKEKKGNESSLRQGQQQTPQPLCKQRSTKTVHILINNLDQQIQESYRKLNSIRKKNSPNIQEPPPSNQTSMLQGNSSTFEHSIHKRTSSTKQGIFNSPFTKKSANYKNNPRSVLLDNHQLMEYIHLVYQMYNIPNPLHQEREEYTTGKKTVQTRKEIGSASTIKNSYICQDNQVSAFEAGEEEDRIQRSRKERDKKIKLTGSRVKNEIVQNREELTISNQKIRLKREESIENHPQPRVKTEIQHPNQIPQIFRFCFMCEQPILQNNLEWHQKTCIPLQQAIAHKTLAELIDILDAKIQKFKKQIHLNLINKSEERLKEELNEIRSSVQNWMDQLPPQELTTHRRNFSNMDNSHQYRKSFTQIQQSISRSSWCSYDSIRKLQWFSKLRESITLRYLLK